MWTEAAAVKGRWVRKAMQLARGSEKQEVLAVQMLSQQEVLQVQPTIKSYLCKEFMHWRPPLQSCL